MKGSIYIIRNHCNDKVYIGQTTMSVEDRWKSHLKPSIHKTRGSYKIYNAMKKYGKHNFYIELLETDIPVNLLDDKEISYIQQYDSYNSGYNSTKGGDGRFISNQRDVDYIVESYKNGRSTGQLAEEYGVHSSTIRRTLRAQGVDISDTKAKIDEDFLSANYLTMTYPELAKHFNVDEKTIRRRLKKLGLHKRRVYRQCRTIDVEGLIMDKERMSMNELSHKYDLSKTSIYRIIREHKNQKDVSTIR